MLSVQLGSQEKIQQVQVMEIDHNLFGYVSDQIPNGRFKMAAVGTKCHLFLFPGLAFDGLPGSPRASHSHGKGQGTSWEQCVHGWTQKQNVRRQIIH